MTLLVSINLLGTCIVDLRNPVVESTHTDGQVVQNVVAARLDSYQLVSTCDLKFIGELQVDLKNKRLEDIMRNYDAVQSS